MGIDLKRYNELKDDADEQQRNADKARGAAETLTKQLESDFGVKTLKAARTKLKALQKEQTDAEIEYERALAAYLEEFEGEG